MMKKILLALVCTWLAAPSAQAAAVKCVNGKAGPYDCKNVDLMAFLPHSTWGGGAGNDIWGWTDPVTGHEWALVGMTRGTAFVDVTDPVNPRYMGFLPCTNCVFPVGLHEGPTDQDNPRCSPHELPGDPGGGGNRGGEIAPLHGECSGDSQWRDIEVYADHAYIGSEQNGHGLVVFDLRQLRTITNPPAIFNETFRFAGLGNSHTITVNPESGRVYVNGSRSANTASACGVGPATNGGPVMFDASQNPSAPVFVGCNLSDGYTHDSQCLTYRGPDTRFTNHEICMNSNEDTLTIMDVTNPASPVMLNRIGYAGSGYTHQGWFVGGHRYFLLDDELDESNSGNNTKTYIFDVNTLDAAGIVPMVFTHQTKAIDHNQYVWGNLSYQSNYRAGLRIMETQDVASGQLTEVGLFDIFTADNNRGFNGTWANFPFFESGTVVVNTIESSNGLYVLRPTLADLKVTLAAPPVAPLPGQTASYVYTVLNQGPAPASAAILDFSLLGGDVVSATTTLGTCQVALTRCKLGAVPKNQPVTVTLRVRPEVSYFRLRAAATATEVDTRPADNSVRVEGTAK
jgi:choice-of-anchor B domain-containing protein